PGGRPRSRTRTSPPGSGTNCRALYVMRRLPEQTRGEQQKQRRRDGEFQWNRQIRRRYERLDDARDYQHGNAAEDEPDGERAGVGHRLTPRQKAREEDSLREPQARTAGDDDGRQLERPVRRDEAPQRQA